MYKVEYSGVMPDVYVHQWQDEWGPGYRRVLYRFASFAVEDEHGNKEMLEIFVPRQEIGSNQHWEPICAHHVQVDKGTIRINADTSSYIRVPVRLAWQRWNKEVYAGDIRLCEQAVTDVVAFYQDTRQRLLKGQGMPEWNDVLTEDKEALVEASAKRFFGSMVTILQHARDAYPALDLKKHNPYLFPNMEYLAFVSSYDTGPLPYFHIIAVTPEDGVPFLLEGGDFVPMTAHLSLDTLSFHADRSDRSRRYSIEMCIPPVLQQRLRIRKIHHEASMKHDQASGTSVFYSRLLGVGIIDENNPGVFALEGLHRGEDHEYVFGTGATFCVAPLFALPHIQMPTQQGNWFEVVFSSYHIKMP